MKFHVYLSIFFIQLVNLCRALSPAILIPGDGGCRLEAKLNKTEVVHYLCEKTSTDYFDIWLNLEQMVPYVIDCWVDNMRLRYDNVSRHTYDAPGVDIRVAAFGNTSSIEWLDTSRVAPGRYFVDIANALVSTGLIKNIGVNGAPYDFRRAPNEFDEYYLNLKTLIQESYYRNGYRRVVLVAHSMGCPTMLYFLKKQSKSWKRKYIRALVTLSGPYGGAVKALRMFASGDDLSVYVLRPLKMRPEQRACSSLSFLLPSDKFYNSSEVLIQTTKRNYTVADYKQFFTDIDFMTGYDMWEDTRDLVYDLQDPGVELHCLHGVGVPTGEKYVYGEGKFPDSQPTVVNGDGDGSVTRRSLEGCLRWKNSSKQRFFYKTFDKVGHSDILHHEPALEYIKKLVSSDE